MEQKVYEHYLSTTLLDFSVYIFYHLYHDAWMVSLPSEAPKGQR